MLYVTRIGGDYNEPFFHLEQPSSQANKNFEFMINKDHVAFVIPVKKKPLWFKPKNYSDSPNIGIKINNFH